jgi:hypothetical protein
MRTEQASSELGPFDTVQWLASESDPQLMDWSRLGPGCHLIAPGTRAQPARAFILSALQSFTLLQCSGLLSLDIGTELWLLVQQLSELSGIPRTGVIAPLVVLGTDGLRYTCPLTQHHLDTRYQLELCRKTALLHPQTHVLIDERAVQDPLNLLELLRPLGAKVLCWQGLTASQRWNAALA